MFTIKGDTLNGILDAILQITKEAKFELSKNDMTVRCVDDSQVEMIVVDLPKAGFTSYNDDNNGELGLDIGQLKTMIGGISEDIVFTKDGGKLKLTFGKTKYTMGLIDPTAIKTMPKLPNFQFDNTVAIDVGELNSAIKSAKNIAEPRDEFILMAKDKTLSVRYENKMNSVQTDIMTSESLKESIAKYSIEYLDAIGKILKGCKDVALKYSSDYPLQITAKLGESSIMWLIAPRMEVKE